MRPFQMRNTALAGSSRNRTWSAESFINCCHVTPRLLHQSRITVPSTDMASFMSPPDFWASDASRQWVASVSRSSPETPCTIAMVSSSTSSIQARIPASQRKGAEEIPGPNDYLCCLRGAGNSRVSDGVQRLLVADHQRGLRAHLPVLGIAHGRQLLALERTQHRQRQLVGVDDVQ